MVIIYVVFLLSFIFIVLFSRFYVGGSAIARYEGNGYTWVAIFNKNKQDWMTKKRQFNES
jgi:hypothetical protein